MSRDRASKKAGWAWTKDLPKGPGGKALCRQCSTEVPKGRRRTFCSDECVDRWKMATSPSYVRIKLEERDHGVCSRCGLDTAMFTQMFYRATYEQQVRQVKHFNLSGRSNGWRERRINGWDGPWVKFAPLKTLWDAHHIVAVRDGGGETGLDNYTTLCWLCHPEATKEQNTVRKLRHLTVPDERDRSPNETAPPRIEVA